MPRYCLLLAALVLPLTVSSGPTVPATAFNKCNATCECTPGKKSCGCVRDKESPGGEPGACCALKCECTPGKKSCGCVPVAAGRR